MISLIKDLQKSVSACGQVDIAKSLKVYNQQLIELTSGIEGQIGTIKEKMTGILTPEMISEFEQIFTKPKEPADALKIKLKEVESQLRACGETAKANKIKEYLQETEKKTIDVDSSINELKRDIEECFGTKAVDEFNKKLNATDNETKKTSKGINFGDSLKTALGIGTVALGIRKAVSFFEDATSESVDFVEQQNLFNVSMGRTIDQYGSLDKEASKYYTKAIAFQEKLEEKLGINIAESMQYQALFNAMSKSMGISADKSYLLSENFTKLGYDLSSLYNIDPENAMQKLRAGLSGQTKPLRDLGLDITQQSLEPLLDELGIERSVKQLSQAEKMVARYIVVLRQASLAHGDFAKTMDSPANQLRIFNAQLVAFKRNMGNLWQGLLGNILPYVNAIMMVINELLKMIAKLFGFKVSEQNANISAGIGVDDLADDLGSATGKAKELKKQLMGFDEINNITLPDNSSSSSGGASAGGIDPKLLNAMKEYDNLIDQAKNKATEIRDKMMEWLGFHRTEDGWKLNDGLTNAEKILDVMKLIGVAIGAWKVAKKITDLMHNLGIISKTGAFGVAFGITLTATGIFAQYKGTKHLLNGDITIFSLLETFLGTGAGAFGIATLLKGFSVGKHSALGLGGRLTIGLGIMLAIQGVQVIADGIKTGNIMKQVLGTLGLGAGTLMATSGLLGWTVGWKIALAVTVVATVTELLGNLGVFTSEYSEKLKECTERSRELSKAIEESNTAYSNQKQAIEDSATSKLAEMEYASSLKDKLKDLVDENGKVISGYEGRVDFILGELNSALGVEYEAENGIIKNYQEMQNEIENIIKAKKKEIEQEAYLELYREAIKKQIEDTKKQVQAQEEFNKVLETRKAIEDENFGVKKLANMHQYNIAFEKAKENLDATNQVLLESSNEVSYYSTQVDNLANNVVTATGTISTEVPKTVIETTENMKELAKTNTDEFILRLNEMNEATKANILAQTTTVSTLSPEIQNEWSKLANGSRDNFVTAINQVPLDTQGAILSSITAVDGLNEATKEAWLNLSKTSADEFYKNISQVEPMTRGQILASIAETEELTEDTKKAWEILSNEDNKAYNAGIASLDNDTANKIQKAINEVKNRQGEAGVAGGNIGASINDNFGNRLGTAEWSARNFIQGFINVISGNPLGIFQIVGGLASSIVSHFNSGLGNHSPSRKTKQSAIYFIEGFRNQINRLKSNSLNQIKELAIGMTDVFDRNLKVSNIADNITVNPNDFIIDTNQFVDYGQISGAIATQSNVKIDNSLDSRIENAIYRGLSNATIPVEIEARTDEGIIFKKVQTKAREFTMQTGEPAFEV